ncbi:tetratricopeptide repeat protein [Geomonas edaphica]|uniref:tetratricopeptide repeat protein n=1 Tax=Geomonas edaphica TaxID=2570226 RepID=UPI0010A87032|nr:tetratricopeptide repeat protein [Geomonas edaphica]
MSANGPDVSIYKAKATRTLIIISCTFVILLIAAYLLFPNGMVVTSKPQAAPPTRAKTEKANDVDAAIELFKQDSNSGIRQLIGLADAHNNEASLQLSAIYSSGNEVVPDRQKYLKYLKLSAKDGNPIAEDQLGVEYNNGTVDGEKKSMSKAFKLFKSSASKNEPRGIYHLGRMYWLGNACKKNIPEGIALIKRAADNGCEEAQYTYAGILWEGKDAAKDLNTAHEYASKAAAENVNDASNLLRLVDAEISISKPLTDESAYEIGNAYMILGQRDSARAAYRRGCYGKYESDDKDPQSPSCRAYFKLEMGIR